MSIQLVHQISGRGSNRTALHHRRRNLLGPAARYIIAIRRFSLEERQGVASAAVWPLEEDAGVCVRRRPLAQQARLPAPPI